MQNHRFFFKDAGIDVADLKRYAEGWILDSEYRQLPLQTLYSRRLVTSNLNWFLRQREYTMCGSTEIRVFLA